MELCRRILTSTISQISPSSFINTSLSVTDDKLCIGHQTFELKRNLTVIGFGKSAYNMWRSVEPEVGHHVKHVFLSVPHVQDVNSVYPKVNTQPGCNYTLRAGAEHNLPDATSVGVTRAIVRHCKLLRDTDLVLCLFGGGGSASLCDPVIDLSDMLAVIKLLVSHGATIQQLNTVRSFLDNVKGGGLALTSLPATVVTLIISDVIGDPLESIASGPTTINNVTGYDVFKVCSDLAISTSLLPASVLNILDSSHFDIPILYDTSCKKYSTSSLSATCYNVYPVYNYIVGSNKVALKRASELSEISELRTTIVTSELCGEARVVGRDIANKAMSLVNELQTPGVYKAGEACLLFGGETTVTFTGKGLGGRCQELALSAGLTLSPIEGWEIVILAAGTDGQDGPTPAAGAVVDTHTAVQANVQGLDMAQYLRNNDSHNFFRALNNGDNLVTTGLTGTNVMDLIIVTVTRAAV